MELIIPQKSPDVTYFQPAELYEAISYVFASLICKQSPNKTKPSNLVLLMPVSSQDDIIDDVEDFVSAAEILKERGAYKIYIMATHGLLSADAPRLIEESAIDEVN